MSQCETALQSHAINVWYWVWRRMVVLEFAVWVSNQGFRSSSSLGLGRKTKIDSSLCVWSSPLLLKHLLAEIMCWNPELMVAKAYFTMDFRARLLRDLQVLVSHCLAASSTVPGHVGQPCSFIIPGISCCRWKRLASPLSRSPASGTLHKSSSKNLPSDRLASLKQPLEKSPLPVRPLCTTLLLQMFSHCLCSLLLDLSCNICLIQIAFSAHWPSCTKYLLPPESSYTCLHYFLFLSPVLVQLSKADISHIWHSYLNHWHTFPATQCI